MTIANKQLPIRGAMRRGEDIEFSDFAWTCTTAQYIGVRLRREGDAWHLDGARLAGESTGPAKGLSIKPGATGKSADGPTVELELDGADKVGDYPVALVGTVQAIECK